MQTKLSLPLATSEIPEEPLFSILIPTWNNLAFLQLCIRSIHRNSTYRHQILIHVNDGSDGTLEWVKEQGIEYTHSRENIGICWSMNLLRTKVRTEYILYLNDDMYVCPGWDEALWQEIRRAPDKRFFFSSTMIQKRFCPYGTISPADFGDTPADFREEQLLKQYADFPCQDWFGATPPPNVVHRDLWDLVGGYSVEFSPGMYSDPDFSAKLWMAGVRLFKGVAASRVYHFEARSTTRIRKNRGENQFLFKWGLTSSSFRKDMMKKGEPFKADALEERHEARLRRNILRSKLKRLLCLFRDNMAQKLWE